MKNIYLEKIASKQDHVDTILNDYHERSEEIEEPIRAMHSDMEEMERVYAMDTPNQPYSHHRSYLLESIRANRESALRRDLRLDEKHLENKINTAKKLLVNEDLAHLVTEDNASSVIKNFTSIKSESNGYKGLKVLGTVGATLAGGAMGFAAGMHTRSPLAALATTATGAISGGYLGHLALKNGLKDSIAERDEEIHTNRGHRIDAAYDKLRRTLNPV